MLCTLMLSLLPAMHEAVKRSGICKSLICEAPEGPNAMWLACTEFGVCWCLERALLLKTCELCLTLWLTVNSVS